MPLAIAGVQKQKRKQKTKQNMEGSTRLASVVSQNLNCHPRLFTIDLPCLMTPLQVRASQRLRQRNFLSVESAGFWPQDLHTHFSDNFTADAEAFVEDDATVRFRADDAAPPLARPLRFFNGDSLPEPSAELRTSGLDSSSECGCLVEFFLLRVRLVAFAPRRLLAAGSLSETSLATSSSEASDFTPLSCGRSRPLLTMGASNCEAPNRKHLSKTCCFERTELDPGRPTLTHETVTSPEPHALSREFIAKLHNPEQVRPQH
jgi:hypothetical protein